MRAFLSVASFTFAAIGVSMFPLACNQDAAASNQERDTHMGDIRAVAAPAMGMPVGIPSAPPSPTMAPQTAVPAPVGPPPASPSVSASATQPAPHAPLIQKKP